MGDPALRFMAADLWMYIFFLSMGAVDHQIIIFNRKKPPLEPGSGRSTHLLLPVWVEGRKMGQGHAVESPINLVLSYTVKKMDVATMTSLIASLHISPAGRSLDLQCIMG